MKDRYRVGIIGFAHMHIVEHVQYFLRKKERIQWIGAAPAAPLLESGRALPLTRGDNLERCRQLGAVPRLYGDYHELLMQKPDLILLGCENYLHTKVVCDTVELGIHVLVDKPLAYTLSQAEEMKRASIRGGGEIITNWPVAWKPSVRLGKRLLEQGAVGEPLRISFHNPDSLGPFCHGPEMKEEDQAKEWWYQKEKGGGSLVDYCCYGCSLLLEYMEKRPKEVFAITKNFLHPYSNAEDYAGIVLDFGDAVGWIEGSWSLYASGTPTGPVVWGTKGAIVVDYANGFRVDLYRNKFSGTPAASYRPDASYMIPGRSVIEEEVLHFLDTGEPVQKALGLERNMEIAALLESADKSAASGRMEPVIYPAQKRVVKAMGFQKEGA